MVWTNPQDAVQKYEASKVENLRKEQSSCHGAAETEDQKGQDGEKSADVHMCVRVPGACCCVPHLSGVSPQGKYQEQRRNKEDK